MPWLFLPAGGSGRPAFFFVQPKFATRRSLRVNPLTREARRRLCRSYQIPVERPARPIGEAGVAGAIGNAVARRIAAESEIRGAGFADRPAALRRAQLEQRALVRTVDRRLVIGRSGVGGSQHVALRTDAQTAQLRAQRFRSPPVRRRAWRL